MKQFRINPFTKGLLIGLIISTISGFYFLVLDVQLEGIFGVTTPKEYQLPLIAYLPGIFYLIPSLLWETTLNFLGVETRNVPLQFYHFPILIPFLLNMLFFGALVHFIQPLYQKIKGSKNT